MFDNQSGILARTGKATLTPSSTPPATPPLGSAAGATFGHAGYPRRPLEADTIGFVVENAPAEMLASAIRR